MYSTGITVKIESGYFDGETGTVTESHTDKFEAEEKSQRWWYSIKIDRATYPFRHSELTPTA